MYKRASRSLQHAHRVAAPLPTGGYIGLIAEPRDALPGVEGLSRPQLASERTQLQRELLRVQADLTVAKLARDERAVQLLGQQHQTIQTRLAAVKARLAIGRDERASETLAVAIREICDEETQARIFSRARQLNKEREAAE